MVIEIVRFSSGPRDTLGLLFIDEEFQCFVLEDPYQPVKIPGETRIPDGVYDLALRTEGGLHQKYLARFPRFHKGMIWVKNVPGFEWIYLHIGNRAEDSRGCQLLGNICRENKTSPGFVGNSTEAYKRIYPIISTAILTGEVVRLSVWSLHRGFQ